ncbi:hypothetical protein [Thalassoroseus pseudoceratinae]|uniref:hypothetical protein n=1 Tax=Thalassoroseus pseudoceratinae TaxID=2713176 RepID=UPI0014227D37|nr:hypothetical protein [Thalassoroseus pseudoceratinae]
MIGTFVVLMLASLATQADAPTVIVVTGAPGTEEYGTAFNTWADRWQTATEEAKAQFIRIGDASDQDDRQVLQQKLKKLEDSKTPAVWLVLIGHGTFDGTRAKFNLHGPDVTAEELAKWLTPLPMPLAVINTASASGPFVNRLSGPNRVIVTATKSGFEHNYARFGDYLSQAISDAEADLDKDEQVSLLEAFLAASSHTNEFYKQDARLVSEHALIDDNGDGLGTPADWFRGYRAIRTAKDGAQADGLRANQFVLIRRGDEAKLSETLRQRRDELERQIAELREKKSSLPEDEYYARLEPVLIELAKLYQDTE